MHSTLVTLQTQTAMNSTFWFNPPQWVEHLIIITFMVGTFVLTWKSTHHSKKAFLQKKEPVFNTLWRGFLGLMAMILLAYACSQMTPRLTAHTSVLYTYTIAAMLLARIYDIHHAANRPQSIRDAAYSGYSRIQDLLPEAAVTERRGQNRLRGHELVASFPSLPDEAPSSASRFSVLPHRDN